MLLLRLMAEVPDAAGAEAELRRAAPRIQEHAAIARWRVERYGKIPEYQEITLHLRPLGPAAACFDALLALAPAGWTAGEPDADRWAVWNPAPGAELLTPRIRWAELQLRGPDEHRDDLPEARS